MRCFQNINALKKSVWFFTALKAGFERGFWIPACAGKRIFFTLVAPEASGAQKQAMRCFQNINALKKSVWFFLQP
jgi:hypothetical protein